MAKLVVVSTTNSVKVTMNDYFTNSITEQKKGVWSKDNIHFEHRGTYIIVGIEGQKEWRVGYTEDLANRILKIDTVDTVAPADLDDLYDKLEAMLA